MWLKRERDSAQVTRGTVIKSTQELLSFESNVFKMKPQACNVTKLAIYTTLIYVETFQRYTLKFKLNKHNIGDHNSVNRPDQAKSW